MFDINKAIKQSGLSKAEVVRLQKEVRKDYSDDSMLYELHLIRALRAERKSARHSAVPVKSKKK